MYYLKVSLRVLVEFRVVIFGESQPAKNRNVSRQISNLSRLNWSSERNSVYCFSTVFTISQQALKYPILVYPVILPVKFLSPATRLTYPDLYLTAANWPATLFFFFPRISTLLHILHIRLSFGIVHSIIRYSTT